MPPIRTAHLVAVLVPTDLAAAADWAERWAAAAASARTIWLRVASIWGS
jgi:hypothetical protein